MESTIEPDIQPLTAFQLYGVSARLPTFGAVFCVIPAIESTLARDLCIVLSTRGLVMTPAQVNQCLSLVVSLGNAGTDGSAMRAQAFADDYRRRGFRELRPNTKQPDIQKGN